MRFFRDYLGVLLKMARNGDITDNELERKQIKSWKGFRKSGGDPDEMGKDIQAALDRDQIDNLNKKNKRRYGFPNKDPKTGEFLKTVLLTLSSTAYALYPGNTDTLHTAVINPDEIHTIVDGYYNNTEHEIGLSHVQTLLETRASEACAHVRI